MDRYGELMEMLSKFKKGTDKYEYHLCNIQYLP